MWCSAHARFVEHIKSELLISPARLHALLEMWVVRLSLKMLHLCDNLSLSWSDIFGRLTFNSHIGFAIQEVILVLQIHLG